ncbi:uncharacterized protein LOC120214597 [Hibiscus syriacus]|uniref:uncharacterized protein LOC120214597 n=1 Tax=Hibiscus syriacus TaxID=106335 RepID=UPI001921AF6E|nr:uncharacterized protein LOC120214597 [Hibiscus syriacus]
MGQGSHGLCDRHTNDQTEVSPLKKVLRFMRKGKLTPRFIGPYEVLKRIGLVAYRLALPLELERIHNVFHVSMLRKYCSDLSHVILLGQIEVSSNITYQEEPMRILESEVHESKNKRIPFVKVLWRNHGIEKTTWEIEEDVKL